MKPAASSRFPRSGADWPECRSCEQNSPRVLLEYLERPSIVIPGPVTGRAYAFPGPHTVKSVRAVDVEGLVRTGFFRRVS